MYGRGGLKGTFEGKGASDRFVKITLQRRGSYQDIALAML